MPLPLSRHIFQFFDFSSSRVLEDVELLTELFLQLRSYCSEFFEKAGDFAFLSEQPYSSFFDFLLFLAFQIIDFGHQGLNFLFHIFVFYCY